MKMCCPDMRLRVHVMWLHVNFTFVESLASMEDGWGHLSVLWWVCLATAAVVLHLHRTGFGVANLQPASL